MTLRILSGVILPNRTSGTVQIGFNPHQLVSTLATLAKVRTVGEAGDFVRRPAAMVAVRQFRLLDPSSARVIINDSTSLSSLTVTWKGAVGGGLVLIEEISYMVIGEVD